MLTALDSSVLWTILNEEADARLWEDTLLRLAGEGDLLVCPVVFAELAPSVSSADRLHALLGDMGARFDPIGPEAAFLAGQIFKRYRASGGPRESMIPDFLVAAHAQVQAQRLAAIDRGYLRRHFPKLALVAPRP